MPIVVTRLDDHRTGSVPEQDGPIADRRVCCVLLRSHRPIATSNGDIPSILPGHEWSVDVGADDEEALELARLQQGIGKIERVEESRALLANIKGGNIPKPHPRLQQRTVAGEEVVRCHRREDQAVDIGGRHPRRYHRLLGCHHPQFGGPLPRIGIVPLLDAAPGADPLVRRIHDLRQHVVLHDIRRNTDSSPDDDGSHASISPLRRRSCSRPRDRPSPPPAAPRAAADGRTRWPTGPIAHAVCPCRYRPPASRRA